MHRAALVRSVNHRAGCHNPLASYTGYEEFLPDITSTKDTYPPSMGSVCAYLEKKPGKLPPVPEATDDATLDLPPDDLPVGESLPADKDK